MAKKKKASKKAWKQQQRLYSDMAAAGWTPPAQAGNQGILGGLTSLLPSRPQEQFLVGALIGAAAAYVLSDDELRGKIIRSGLKLYGSLVGGLAEMKEQVADLQAELEAERAGEL